MLHPADVVYVLRRRRNDDDNDDNDDNVLSISIPNSVLVTLGHFMDKRPLQKQSKLALEFKRLKVSRLLKCITW